MQNIDELLRQQRQLIAQMDMHYMRQVENLKDRIQKAKSPKKLPTLSTVNGIETGNLGLGRGDIKQKSAADFRRLPTLGKSTKK